MLEPNAIEIVMALLALLAVALFIWAIIGLAFSRRFLSAGEAWLWFLAILGFPILGSVLWLATSRRFRRRVSAS